ncbi:MAG: hypothetical protein K5798_10500 [Nitrosopumilus sp.]|uniref:methane monooxygenase/ammonia monooxygenase subunit B n=1 Tax=Nitrosopumilus sp. TaxID=2024843 RepID=UPI0024306D90|nr:methane monooxygenase/ammonia monooxygenase subunit B [Nitrosopumilus sp.]MCV0367675.1 hypothetical protein [Nitrosopumilus sp.]
MKISLLMLIAFFVFATYAELEVYGHGVSSGISTRVYRVEDEIFSIQNASTEGQPIIINGKLVSLADYSQQLEISLLVTTDQFQTWSASTVIHNLQYGIQREYQEHDDWFFQTLVNPAKITLKPGETKEYEIVTMPLKAGTYHLHTQVTSDRGSQLGPGQTIIVEGVAHITSGEVYGIYVRFASLVLLGVAGIVATKKIMSNRRKRK